jgi:hypothetical protein
MARRNRIGTKLAHVAMQLHVTPGAEWHDGVTKSCTTPDLVTTAEPSRAARAGTATHTSHPRSPASSQIHIASTG